MAMASNSAEDVFEDSVVQSDYYYYMKLFIQRSIIEIV